MKDRKTFWRRGWEPALSVGIALFLSSATGWLMPRLLRVLTGSPAYAIAEIRVTGNHLITTEQVLERAGVKPGENLFDLDLAAAAARLEGDSRIRHALLVRQWPNRLIIQVEEQQPVALLSLERMYGLSREGQVFPLPATVPLPDYPIVTGLPGSVQDGAEAGLARVIEILEALQRFPELITMVSEINVTQPDDPLLYLINTGVKIRLGVGQYPTKLIHLHLILAHWQTRSGAMAYIDLRFRQQAAIKPVEKTGT